MGSSVWMRIASRQCSLSRVPFNSLSKPHLRAILLACRAALIPVREHKSCISFNLWSLSNTQMKQIAYKCSQECREAPWSLLGDFYAGRQGKRHKKSKKRAIYKSFWKWKGFASRNTTVYTSELKTFHSFCLTLNFSCIGKSGLGLGFSSGQTDSQVDASLKDSCSICVSFGHPLAMTCVDFGRAQIRTQVDASFSPFGHPTQSRHKLIASQLKFIYLFIYLFNQLCFCDLRGPASRLANPFGHP